MYVGQDNKFVRVLWRRIGKEDVELHAFLTSALYGGEWSASRPGHHYSQGNQLIDRLVKCS